MIVGSMRGLKPWTCACILITGIKTTVVLLLGAALLHKSAVGQDMPNPKWIYAAATVWGVPSAVN